MRAGYSLLEVLIVVAILGLLAALAAPPFLRTIEQQRDIASRAAAERSMGQLPLQAREEARDLLFRPPGASATSIPRPSFASPVTDPRVAAFRNLPEGWKIEPAEDIWVRYDGVCFGGEVALVNPREQRLAYILDPPFCRPRRVPERDT